MENKVGIIDLDYGKFTQISLSKRLQHHIYRSFDSHVTKENEHDITIIVRSDMHGIENTIRLYHDNGKRYFAIDDKKEDYGDIHPIYVSISEYCKSLKFLDRGEGDFYA